MHPILIVPDIVYLIFGSLLLLSFGYYTGLTAISQEEVYRNITSNLSKFFSSLIVVVLIGFFVGARLKAFKLKMILDTSHHKRVHLFEAFKESKKFFWRVVSLKIMSFLILLIGFTLAVMLYLLTENINPLLASIVAVLVMFVFILSLFFREAALFKEDSEPTKALMHSFTVFKKNKALIFILAILILLINVSWASTNSLVPKEKSVISSILSLIYMLLVFMIAAWSQLLIFNSYHTLRKKHKLVKKKRKTKRKRS